MRERRGAAGRGYSVRRNAAKGRKKFLTCLRYMRRSSRYFTRVSEVAKQTPPTRSLSLSPSPSPPYFALLSNLLSSFQAPLHPRSLPHSPLPPLLLLLLLHVGVLHTLFTPFAGARALLSFDGESEWSHVPWRTAASFNWDAEP